MGAMYDLANAGLIEPSAVEMRTKKTIKKVNLRYRVAFIVLLPLL